MPCSVASEVGLFDSSAGCGVASTPPGLLRSRSGSKSDSVWSALGGSAELPCSELITPGSVALFGMLGTGSVGSSIAVGVVRSGAVGTVTLAAGSGALTLSVAGAGSGWALTGAASFTVSVAGVGFGASGEGAFVLGCSPGFLSASSVPKAAERFLTASSISLSSTATLSLAVELAIGAALTSGCALAAATVAGFTSAGAGLAGAAGSAGVAGLGFGLSSAGGRISGAVLVGAGVGATLSGPLVGFSEGVELLGAL